MKIASERKIVAMAVAVFVTLTTITHGIVGRSPESVLKATTPGKTEFKSVTTQPPEYIWWEPLLVFGLYLYFTYQCMPAQQPGEAVDQYQIVQMGPPKTGNPVSPGTVALVQDLP